MPTSPSTKRSSSLFPLFPVCLVAVGAAAIYEGIAAARATRASDAGWFSSTLAFTAAAAVIFAFATPVAAALARVAQLGSTWLARRPGAEVRPGFAWRAAAYIALLGNAATTASIAGRHVIGTMSPHFAATAIVALAFAAGGTALLLAKLIIAGLELGAKRLGRTHANLVAAIDRRVGPLVLVSVTLVVANALLPAEHFATPAWALLAAALFAATPLPERMPTRWLEKASLALAIVLFLGLRGVEKLPPRARLGVIYRTPWTSLMLGTARSLVDRDRDGFSPIFGGGDCNDGDARVHPDAIDVPGDGIDQNCSGSDAPLPPSSQPTAPLANLAGPGGLQPSSHLLHPERPTRTSFVFVHLDALRPDHLGFTGYARKTSPHIDRFRQEATYFSQAYTLAPATRFAMASLFTGRDVDHLAIQRGAGIDLTLLPEAQTLAETLGSAGYDRVGWTISYVMSRMPGMGQGFRTWESPWPVADGDSYLGRDAPLTTDRAVDYLTSRSPDAMQTPFMMYTHYQCTHHPYIKHKEWDFGDDDVDRYDSALSYCDREVGRLLDTIDKQPDHDRIAVVLFSDHGELLGEHGLATHGTSLFEEELRALLLVRLPWATPATVDARVTLTDLYPTVLDLAGVAPDPSTRAWNLEPLLDGTSHGENWQRPLYLYIDQWRGSVRLTERGVLDGPYKYVRDVATGAAFLFDEAGNPTETTNLRDRLPAARDRLAGMLDARAALD